MKVILALGHPAHFHLFRCFISKFTTEGNVVKIVISDKDILRNLLEDQGYDYEILYIKKADESLFEKGFKILKSSIKLRKIIRSFKPDLVLGCLTQIAYATLFTRTPAFFFGEDDINYTFLQGMITYPFVKGIVAPKATKTGIFARKKIAYRGFQKLAYLHPNQFTPEINKISPITPDDRYFLIRLVNLKAYHDLNAGGFTTEILDRLINLLSAHGRVFISSEKILEEKYLSYKIPVAISDIHHALAFASIYIGDSQSMAVEAAMLGTPSVRFNKFAGRISVLEELEHKYRLTFGIHAHDSMMLFEKINELLVTPDLKNTFSKRKDHMLAENIDVTAFFVDFVYHWQDYCRDYRGKKTVK